jgi:hypothetical protein
MFFLCQGKAKVQMRCELSCRSSDWNVSRIISFLLYVLIAHHIVTIAENASCSLPYSQYQALAEFYDSTNGASWCLPSESVKWNFTTSTASIPCSAGWVGLKCSSCTVKSNFQDIIGIVLPESCLSGSISSTIGQLSYVQLLDLSDNRLNGRIPSTLDRLLQLEILLLGGNSLTGPIPSSFGFLSQLKVIDLDTNSLNGTIPTSLGNISQLLFLDLDVNRLSGTIPSSLAQLSNLVYLYLAGNYLTGTIPPSFGNLSQLAYLYISYNNFSGTIPSSLGKLSQLLILDLQSSNLRGTIPSSLGNISTLQDLFLSFNYLTGTVPLSLGFALQFQLLHLDSNCLTGTIPSSFGRLSLLQYLQLENNSLTGAVPSSFSDLLSIIAIYLYSNFLTSTLPSFGQSYQLQLVGVYYNHFTGTIPLLSENEQLQYLYLDYNHLSGPVFDSITNMSNLVSISISNNLFSGQLPTDYNDFSSLQDLSASSNCLSGSISLSICSLSRTLKSFDLSGAGGNPDCDSNLQLNKQRPFFVQGLFSSLGISGSIPPCLFSFPNLLSMHLSGNKLSGTLSELMSLSRTNLSLSILSLLLSNNGLTGSIPLSIQRHSFLELDLSQNRLDGTLTPDFAISSNQTILKLSVNRLSGQLPNTFVESATAAVSSLTAGSFDILAENVFDCTQDDIPSKDPNSDTYSCGSGELNVAIYSWLSALGLVMTIFLSVSFLQLRLLPRLSSFNDWIGITRSWITMWWKVSEHPYSFRSDLNILLNEEDKLKLSSSPICPQSINNPIKESIFFNDVNVFLSTLKACRKWGWMMVGISVIITLPIFMFMNSSNYAILTSTYGYSVSITFLHNYGLVISIGLFLLVLITITMRIIRGSKPKTFQTISDTTRIESAYTKASLVSVCKIYCLLVCLHIINIVVTVTVNALYVSSLLNPSLYSATSLQAVQVGVGFFKSAWYKSYISWTTKYLMSYMTISAAFRHRLIMSVIDFIVAPVIATLAVNKSCFYYVLRANDAISTVGLAPICVSSSFQNGVFTCNQYALVSFDSTSTPAYNYSYACGSALLRSYVPVLIYTYITFAFLIPTVNMCTVLFEKMFTEDKFLLKGILQAVSVDIFAIDGKVVLFDMINHSIVFLTFGLSFSVLGVIIGLGMVINVLVYQLQVGRLLCLGYEKAEISTSSAIILNEKQLERLQVVDAWTIVAGSSNILALVVFLFWGFIFFDMIADGNDWIYGLIVSGITAVICPIIVLTKYDTVKLWVALWIKNRNSEEADRNPAMADVDKEMFSVEMAEQVETNVNAISNPIQSA